ncbi:hypothetical protein R3I94_015890 [Phoxinus phoxinus]
MSLLCLKSKTDGLHCFQKNRLVLSLCAWFLLISTSLSSMDSTSMSQDCYRCTECELVAVLTCAVSLSPLMYKLQTRREELLLCSDFRTTLRRIPTVSSVSVRLPVQKKRLQKKLTLVFSLLLRKVEAAKHYWQRR